MKVKDLLTIREKIDIKYLMFLMRLSKSKKKYFKRRNNVAYIIKNALGRANFKN